jgi:putative ABC transport system ATP-binding protein/lipoprotein-releasing system ATP-binding protein
MTHLNKRGGNGSSPVQEWVVELVMVSKHYQLGSVTVKAVERATLEVSAGDFLTITGRSGSGKTTLLSLIGGLTNPTSGQVKVFGQALDDLADAAISTLRAERIGFAFQFASLIPTLTALDNVRLPGLFASRPVNLGKAAELLSWVGLADKRASYPAELSGGQQARVALARALANHPDLLLADEPTGNLDVETEWEVLSLLRELNRERGTTVVLVTHNPELARYGNRHLIMQRGELHETYDWLPQEVGAHE